MLGNWLTTPLSNVLLVFLSTFGIYVATILLTKLNGLRSFSKMSSFDFAMTVAIGALIGSTLAGEEPPLLQGVAALASLFALQYLLALVRARYAETLSIDNQPLLLMDGATVLEENLRRLRLTRKDLYMNLRQAGVSSFDEVRVVVMETNGGMSVLLKKEHALAPELLEGVRRR